MKYLLICILTASVGASALAQSRTEFCTVTKPLVDTFVGRLAPGCALTNDSFVIIDCYGVTRGPFSRTAGYVCSALRNDPCATKPLVLNAQQASLVSASLPLSTNRFAFLDLNNEVVVVSTLVSNWHGPNLAGVLDSMPKGSAIGLLNSSNLIVTYRFHKNNQVGVSVCGWNNVNAAAGPERRPVVLVDAPLSSKVAEKLPSQLFNKLTE